MRFDVSRNKIIKLIERNILWEIRYINDDGCGFDLGEYRLSHTFPAGEVHDRAIDVTFEMFITFYADGRTVVDHLGYSYDNVLSDAEKVGLSDRIFNRVDELKVAVLA